MISRIDAEPLKTDPALAHELTLRLLSCYPNLTPHEPERYAASLVATFAAFPPSVGRRVADPVRGLAARLKFSPSVFDVAEALKAEVERRTLIRANAMWHTQERERRERAAEAERDYQANRPSMEARAAQVARLLGARKDAP